ncbi:MAG: energy-dependent translational throttle protein EttA [Oceanicaulis sp.]
MAAYQYVYHMDNLAKTYPGGKKVFDGISLHFLPDAKIGVVGVNGSGKSTLLRIMAGQDTDFAGEAWAEKGVRVGYLPQEPQLDADKTVWENVAEGSEDKRIYDAYNAIAMKLAEDYSDELMEEMTALQEEVDTRDAWDIDAKIEMAMGALRCPPADSEVTNLSGGEKRRVAICRLLLSKPHVLLLDEPTNHLDAESVAWLQMHLEKYQGVVLIVTHDRYFLDSITTWTLELDRGKGVPYQGGYSSWLEQKTKRLAQESREESAKQRALSRELDWIRASPKARQAKSKARIKSYEEKRDEADREKINHTVINIPPGPRLGGNVVDFDHVSKGFEDKLLIKDLDFKLPPGGVVGVIGPNGAGKTTLFKMIVGEEQPDEGKVTLGETVKLGYVNQSRDALDPKKNVWEEISGGNDMIDLGGREVPSRAYVGAFNFKGGDQQKKVGLLSGGERNRVHLAKMLKEGGNLLLLDEPTNDLDVETLSALESALETYPGCAVVISHDRFFLDRIATHILAFEGDSHVEWFEGGFTDYLADKKRRLGDDALVPSRVKFQKFER